MSDQEIRQGAAETEKLLSLIFKLLREEKLITRQEQLRAEELLRKEWSVGNGRT